MVFTNTFHYGHVLTLMGTGAHRIYLLHITSEDCLTLFRQPVRKSSYCWNQGYEATMQQIGGLASISGLFANFYDSLIRILLIILRRMRLPYDWSW